MRIHKPSYLIGITTLCFLLILIFQIFWLKQSRDLIENQFNQKVSMALCSAVGKLEGCSADQCVMENSPCVAQEKGQDLTFSSDCLHHGLINESILKSSIQDALKFYDLPQTFRVNIIQERDEYFDPESPYCCALGPYNAENDQYITIHFPNRQKYVLDKMWIMLISSFLILLLILAVFILSIRALLTQKRISQFNIDFFNNMAHEFRTPLTTIRLAIHRVKTRNPSLKESPYLKIIEKENLKLNENVGRVLSLAKLQDGQYELRKDHVDLLKLLNDAVRHLSLVIQETNTQIIIDPGIGSFEVWADPLHLRHAFINILDNAMKYCDTTPQIRVRIRVVPEGIKLIFKDNGIGISENERQIIFNRFTRIENQKGLKGFGLGLAYVKMIMDLHKGKIKTSSHSGQGSQFELFLPQIVST